jgi:hypothetical protein
MTDVAPHLTAGFLRTRRSAAIAGIIFGVVLLAAMIMALTAERSDRQRSETRGAGGLSEAKLFDHLETDSAGSWLGSLSRADRCPRAAAYGSTSTCLAAVLLRARPGGQRPSIDLGWLWRVVSIFRPEIFEGLR